MVQGLHHRVAASFQSWCTGFWNNGAFGRRCLGRILETHPGEDGIIRVVTVRTAAGIFKRALKVMCSVYRR